MKKLFGAWNPVEMLGSTRRFKTSRAEIFRSILVLWLYVLANQYFCPFEAGNKKNSELHARSGLRFAVRLQEDA
jgi:hypothetical protein